jgi:TRAP-type C4-dicarboxylate transport system substrate-binding protein
MMEVLFMKKFCVFITIFAMLIFILGICSASAAEKPSYVLSYSSKAANSVQDKALDVFAERLAELSGGRITGKKYIGGSVGGEEELIEAVAMGDMGATYAADIYIGNTGGGGLGWLALPGLVTSYEEAERDTYAKDGWISKLIDEYSEKKVGVKRLASGDNCFRVLATAKEIKVPADLVGLKIRCGNAWENLQLYERAGAISVVIASSETLSALEQGTVDGVENGILNLVSSGVQNAVSYVLPANQIYSSCSIIVNLKWYNSLSAEDQEIVSEAAKSAAEYEIENTRTAIQELINTQVTSGQWTMLDMTPELKEKFRQVSESMWADARKMYGSEVIDTILAHKK